MNSAAHAPFLVGLADHLWQSTLFVAATGLLTLLLRRNSAQIRYWLWLAASIKFLVPFALLTALGAQLPSPFSPSSADATQASFISIAGSFATPVTRLGGMGALPDPRAVETLSTSELVGIAILAVWMMGTVSVGLRWLGRWWKVREALRSSTDVPVEFVIPVKSSAALFEPGVVGVLRPALLLPAGLEKQLTPQQMRAVLAHERCHVLRRDNLAAAIHMLVEAVFWFHPLVWWLGARIVDERERACDEQVLREGHAPEAYAEGILKVCQHYLESRLLCVAGVSGADLRQRIEGIMKNPLIERLSVVRKAVIGIIAGATIAAPVAVGILSAPPARAQAETQASTPAGASYQNVSIQVTPNGANRPMQWTFGGPPGGGTRSSLDIRNLPLNVLIASAYGVSESQVIGRDWSKEPTYDISADGPPLRPMLMGGPEQPAAPLLRDLLARHFGLEVKREKQVMDGHAIIISSSGSKLKAHEGSSDDHFMHLRPDGLSVTDLPVQSLAHHLSKVLRAPVVDQTGLAGNYDFELNWSGVPGQTDASEVAKVMEEQLGLRLQSQPMTVDVIRVVGLKAPEDVATKTALNMR